MARWRLHRTSGPKHSIGQIASLNHQENIPTWNDEGVRSPEEIVLITQNLKEVGQIMSTYVGIVRSNLRLKRAWTRLDILYEETESLFKLQSGLTETEIEYLTDKLNIGTH